MVPEARRARSLVEAAALVDLVAALVESDGWGDRPAMTDDEFCCVVCQRFPSGWLMTLPAAQPAGPFGWACCACRATGTVWGLQALVLGDTRAIERFLTAALAAA